MVLSADLWSEINWYSAGERDRERGREKLWYRLQHLDKSAVSERLL